MNEIILCEGSTDYFLLQYYMREAYQWSDDKAVQTGILKLHKQKSRNLIKNSNILTIMSVGGCSRMGEGLKAVLERNFLSPPDLSDLYSNIVMITDRDEAGTEQSFIQLISSVLSGYNVTWTNTIVNNRWTKCKMTNQMGITEEFSILLMIIPFEENGSMETFLLDAICNDDPYDKIIIDKCKAFIDHIDPAKKYLSSRRYMTKAKFDTYFSVRTPAEQFMERQNILKNVKWEQYTKIQTDLEKLGDL